MEEIHAHQEVAQVAHEPVQHVVDTPQVAPGTPNAQGIASVTPSDLERRDDLSGAPKLYLDKDTPLDFEAPDWLPEGTTVKDLHNRVEGLRKQLGNLKSAPEEYTVNIDPNIAQIFELESNDPMIEQYREVALKNNISQEGFDEVLNMYLDFQAGQAIEEMDFQEKQFQEMGIDQEETFSYISNWARSNLNPDEAEIMENMSMTAPQMKLMTGIIKKFAGQSNIADTVQTPEVFNDDRRLKELKNLMNGGPGALQRINRLYGVKG